MKQLRPVSIALAVLALCTWSVAATACDQNKAKTTNATAASMKSADASSCSPTKASATTAGYTAKSAAAGHACTAEMAANCTPEMAAACAAGKGAKSAKYSTAANASKSSKMSADCCMGKGAKTSATTAASIGGADAKTTVMLAGAGGSCASKSTAKTTAMAAGAGHAGCGDKSVSKATGHTAHADCGGCADFNDCDQALRNMGAALQVVPLKNGVMYVYTSDPSKARAIQSTMSQRKDQMAMFASASSGTPLCGDCKQLRGAAMSGKLAREVVNIEGGCLTLMTSSDPAVVSRIHALAGVAASGRAKI